MKQFAKRGFALLLAVILIVGLLSGLSFMASASTVTVDYVYGSASGYSNVIINWGQRGTLATYLSPNAEKFYENNDVTYAELAALNGASNLNQVTSSALYDELHDLMADNHTTQTSYGDTRYLYCFTDCQNSDIEQLTCFYSNADIGPEWDNGDTWNREHTWPQSKTPDGSGTSNSTKGERADIMSLRPASSSINSSRNNKAYGSATNASYYYPNNESDGTVDVRGDVARIVLYVYVRWENAAHMWGSDGVMESLDVLLQWMEEDPVDTWEMGRNDSVESITGTRNVFVDYPELAFLLFNEEIPAEMSTPAGEGYSSDYTITATANGNGTVKVNGNIITAIPDEGYEASGSTVISGEATVTQSGNIFTVAASSDCTIQIHFAPRTKASVTVMENGQQVTTLNAYVGDTIYLPANKQAAPEGHTFIGWVTSTVSKTEQMPEKIYKVGEAFEITSENAQFHALYTIAEAGESGTVSSFQLHTGEIEEGYYLVVQNGGAMTAATTSQTRLCITAVDINGDTIISTDESLVWYFEEGADGYYTIYNASTGMYAASTGTKNQATLSDSVNDKSKWTVTQNSDNTFDIINRNNQSNNINAYLRRNADYGFATYAKATPSEPPVLYKGITAKVSYTTGGSKIASGICGDDLTWELTSDGTLTISGTGLMTDYDNGISPWDNSAIKHLVIKDGVISIGSRAFQGCSSLTDITFGNDLFTIGFAAFNGCSVLTRVTFPQSISNILKSAFASCTALTEINIPENANCYIAEGAFSNCLSLKTVYIPAGIRAFGDGPFSDCPELEFIEVSKNNPNFCNDAFGALYSKDMTQLIQLPGAYSGAYTIPEGVTTIGRSACYNCNGLTAVTIPASVTDIGGSAFQSCDKLELITFEGNAPEFEWTPLTGVTATAYYPASNKTWTDDVMESAGGSITWVAYAPAVIISQPSTQRVMSGSTAKFTVSASGTGLTYQWQYKTSENGSWKNCSDSGNTSSVLSVSATTGKSSYYYRCRITDSKGSVTYSNEARLYVLGVTSQPTSQKVVAGNTAKFAVSATGAGKTYQWQYKTSENGSWKNCTDSGNTSSTLSVSATTGKNGYYYRCKVMDNSGNVTYSSEARLYVLGVTSQPTTQKVKAGQTVKFSVKASGYSVTYQWQSSTDGKTWKNCSSSTAKNATFTFTGKTSHSSNYYRCKVTDNAGNVIYTDEVRLYVLGVTSQPTSQKVVAGNTVKFAVSATGAGKTYQWQSSADGKTWKNCSSSTAKNATFTFTGKTSHNGNYYRCKIADNAGNVTYTNEVRLYVLGVNTQPTTQKVKSGDQVKFAVKATGDGLKYQWQSSADGKTWKNCSSSTAKNATFTFTGKTSHNGNYYRCKVTDSAGNVVYSKSVRLYVLGITDQPDSKTVSNSKTAKFAVKATGHDVTYRWQYSTDGGKTWTNCKSSNSKNATFTFTATTSKNGYYYRCKITDSAGNVVYSSKAKLTVTK